MAAGYDGTIRIDSSIDGKGFNTGIKGIMGSLKGLAAAVGIAFSIAAVVAFGKAAVDAASELNGAFVGLKSIMDGQGRSFEGAKKFINDYVADGLMPATDAITAYKNLAARGYSTDQIEKTLTALKDSAAFGRQSSLTLGQAVKSASEGLKNENSILVDNAGVTKNVSLMWKDYAASIGVSVTELTKEQKILAEVNGIMQETKFQTGDAAKYANTYAGQLAAIGAAFEKLKAAIGNSIIPVITMILPYIRMAIEAMTQFFTTVAQVSNALFGVQTSTGQTSTNLEDAANASANLMDNLAGTGKAAKGALAAFDQINVLQKDGGSGTPAGIPPITLPPIKKDPLTNSLNEISAEILAFKNSILALFKPMSDAFDRLVVSLTPLGETIWAGLKWAWDNILVPLGNWVITDAAPVFMDLLGAGADALNSALVALKPVGQWLWDNFLLPAGKFVGDALLSYLTLCTDNLKNLKIWMDNNQQAFQVIMGIILLVIAVIFLILNPIALVIVGIIALIAIIANWGKIWEWFKATTIAVWTAVFAFLGTIGNWIKINVIDPVIKWFSSLWANVKTFALNAWNGIVNTWNAAGAWFNSNVIAPVTKWFSSLWLGVKAFAAKAWNGIVNTWVSAANWFKINVTDRLVAVFTPMWNFIKILANNAWVTISFLWGKASAWFKTTVTDPLSNWFKTAWESIKAFAASAWIGIVNTWNSAGTWFRSNVTERISTFFSNSWENIKTSSANAWVSIKNAFASAGQWFNTTVTTPITSFFSTAWESIKTTASNTWGNIQDVFASAGEWFGSNVTDPIKNAFGTAFEWVATDIKSAWDGILDYIKGVINGMVRLLNNMLQGITNGMNILIASLNFAGAMIPGWISIPSLNSPEIPYLATGAVIPPNSQFLAMLGDQKSGRNIEAPEGLIRQIVSEEIRNQPGQKVTISFAGSLAGLVRELKPYIDKENTRVGGSLIRGGAV